MNQAFRDQAFNHETLQHDPPARSSSGSKLIKMLLLAVELLAVAALLAGAFKLWQVRQDLQQELRAAQQMEAALQAAEEPALRRSKPAEAGRHTPIIAPLRDAGAAMATPRPALIWPGVEITHEEKADSGRR